MKLDIENKNDVEFLKSLLEYRLLYKKKIKNHYKEVLKGIKYNEALGIDNSKFPLPLMLSLLKDIALEEGYYKDLLEKNNYNIDGMFKGSMNRTVTYNDSDDILVNFKIFFEKYKEFNKNGLDYHTFYDRVVVNISYDVINDRYSLQMAKLQDLPSL